MSYIEPNVSTVHNIIFKVYLSIKLKLNIRKKTIIGVS